MAVSFDKFKGCFIGLAVGDALGYPVEFKQHDNIISDMISREGKPYPPGTWTDDTSMAICLAESILEKGQFDLSDQIKKYSNWLNNGWMSCVNDKSFGAGKATKRAINEFNINGSIIHGDETTLGNGSIMRLAPIPMLFLNRDLKTVVSLCVESSKTTHNNKECCTECGKLGIILYSLLKESKNYISIVEKNLQENKQNKFPTEIDGKASTTLYNSLWSVITYTGFEHTLISAVNLRGDADSVGAVTGSIAGALYGYSAIPERWLNALQKRDLLEDLVDRMWFFVKNTGIDVKD